MRSPSSCISSSVTVEKAEKRTVNSLSNAVVSVSSSQAIAATVSISRAKSGTPSISSRRLNASRTSSADGGVAFTTAVKGQKQYELACNSSFCMCRNMSTTSFPASPTSFLSPRRVVWSARNSSFAHPLQSPLTDSKVRIRFVSKRVVGEVVGVSTGKRASPVPFPATWFLLRYMPSVSTRYLDGGTVEVVLRPSTNLPFNVKSKATTTSTNTRNAGLHTSAVGVYSSVRTSRR
jgi:hypothetical protein